MEPITSYTPDQLIYDATAPLRTKQVNLASGAGVVERGTVLSVADDAVSVWTADSEGIASYILTDDIDTGDTEGSTVVALVYVTGHFTRQEIAQAADLTAAAEKQLEASGIYLSNYA